MTNSATSGGDGRGFELPFRLLLAFRIQVERLNEQLAEAGYPDARPLHGFALQAVGDGRTASELGTMLNISKQAAGKLVHRLESLGYVDRVADADDARRKLIRLTPAGRDLLARSGRALDAIRAEWVAELGEERVVALEDSLTRMTGPLRLDLDTPGWLTDPGT